MAKKHLKRQSRSKTLLEEAFELLPTTENVMDKRGELLTVTRGTSNTEGERITKVWNQVVNGNVKEAEIPALIKKIKESKWNYSGVFYSVYFRVSTSITLHELGFYGPFDKIKASYFIHIEIFKPNESGQMLPNSWDSSRVLKLKTNVLAEKDEIFFVNLGEGVSIEPCTWYLVQFMLDGPNTLKCETSHSSVIVEHQHGKIQFEFNKGSKQLPAMKFAVK